MDMTRLFEMLAVEIAVILSLFNEEVCIDFVKKVSDLL